MNINKLALSIVIIPINILLLIILYVPIFYGFSQNANLELTLLFYLFIVFNIYSLYLIFSKQLAIKYIIYIIAYLLLIILANYIPSINKTYKIDNCLDSGYSWSYKENNCKKN